MSSNGNQTAGVLCGQIECLSRLKACCLLLQLQSNSQEAPVLLSIACLICVWSLNKHGYKKQCCLLRCCRCTGTGCAYSCTCTTLHSASVWSLSCMKMCLLQSSLLGQGCFAGRLWLLGVLQGVLRICCRYAVTNSSIQEWQRR